MDQNRLNFPWSMGKVCQPFRSFCCCAASVLIESTELWLTTSLSPWAIGEAVIAGGIFETQTKSWIPSCLLYSVSAQICSAPCDQLWCHLWAEHPFLPHCFHPEPWLWSRQWPHETFREVGLSRQVQVPCYGPRTREGTHDFLSISQRWSFKCA